MLAFSELNSNFHCVLQELVNNMKFNRNILFTKSISCHKFHRVEKISCHTDIGDKVYNIQVFCQNISADGQDNPCVWISVVFCTSSDISKLQILWVQVSILINRVYVYLLR